MSAAARPPRPWYDPPVLLAAILLEAARPAWLAASPTPAEGSAEVGFARDMSTHHAQAVEMAEIARGRTSDPEIRTLAIDIALTQQAQIGQMRGWLDVWGHPAAGRDAPMAWMGRPTTGLLPGMATPEELARLRDLPVTEADGRFLELMIAHHRAGAEMAEGIVQRTRRPAVLRLARAIAASQQSEIAAMEELLRRKGLPAPAPAKAHAGTAMSGHAEEGMRDSAAVLMLARQAAGLLPLPLAVFAATWLGLDTLGCRRRTEHARGATGALARVPRVLAIGGLAVSAVVCVGLVPSCVVAGIARGALFAVSGTVLAALGAAILAWPGRATYRAGAALSLVLVVIWALVRLIPAPGISAAAATDLAALVAGIAAVVAAIGCLVALRAAAVRRVVG